jgi:hypothetical protein
MHPGAIEVFAYQETLLMMAIFGIAILGMIWVGFRRWLQHKDRMGRLIAERTAERAAQYGAHIEGVEARLKAVEHIVSDGGAQIDDPLSNPLSGRISKSP